MEEKSEQQTKPVEWNSETAWFVGELYYEYDDLSARVYELEQDMERWPNRDSLFKAFMDTQPIRKQMRRQWLVVGLTWITCLLMLLVVVLKH